MKVVHFLKKNAIYLMGLIFIISVLLALIYQDPTIQGHDLGFHIANIKNLLSMPHLIPSFIVPNIAHNLGYGLYIFYPALPHFLYALFIKTFSLPLVSGVLAFNVIALLLSGFSMYLLSYRVFKKSKYTFLSSLVYMLFPYRLGTITVRMALNENFSGIFLPLILLGVIDLIEEPVHEKRFFLFFILGYVGLFLSHYLISLYFTIFLGVFLLFQGRKFFNKKTLLSFLKATLVVLILVLPQMILFFEHYSLPYLVFQDGYVTSLGLIQSQILTLRDLLIPSVNYDWNIPFYISLPVLIGLFYSVYRAFVEKNIQILTFSVLAFLILFFIVFKPVWQILPSALYNIQFPWRLLLIFSMFVALILPSGFKQIPVKWYIIETSLVFLFTLPLIYILFMRAYHFDYNFISLENGLGNISEYYPVAYLENEEYYKKKENIDVVFGSANIKMLSGSTFERVLFQVSNAKDLEIEFPKIYYKGYQLKDEEGQKVHLYACKNGLLCSKISKDGKYVLQYVGTPLYKIVRIVRILFLLLVGLYFLLKFRFQKKVCKV